MDAKYKGFTVCIYTFSVTIYGLSLSRLYLVLFEPMPHFNPSHFSRKRKLLLPYRTTIAMFKSTLYVIVTM